MAIHVCPHCGKGFETPDLLALPPPRPKRVIDATKKQKRQREKARTGAHVTVAMMAAALSRDPRDIRAALRALAISKPAHGWSWPPSEARVVEAKLRRRYGLPPMSSNAKPPAAPMPAPPANDAHTDDDAQTHAQAS